MSKLPKRRHNTMRLPDYDYSESGGYFVTICTHQKSQILSDVFNDEVKLSDVGRVVETTLLGLPRHYYHLKLGDFVIMPNHIHAILILVDDDIALNSNHMGSEIVGAELRSAPTTDLSQPLKRHTISEIIRAFKSYSTLGIKQLAYDIDSPIWQRGFYDHII